MKISLEHDGEYLPDAVLDDVTTKVSASLDSIVTTGGRFVVNDSLFYRESRKGKITPCVINSATFLSKSFQGNLGALSNAKGETKILKQSIDGFIEYPYEGRGFQIRDKDKMLSVVHGFMEADSLSADSVYTLFPKFYGMFVQRTFFQISHLPEKFHNLFDLVKARTTFRIGVEFETGNIASSFRAINKLFVLFQHGMIDAGVLVTSIDKKSAATRIWPVSNRNGSFEELKNRNYMSQVSLPLVCIGFAPDDFSDDALFLGRDGGLFELRDTGREHSSGRYRIYLGEDDEEILAEIQVNN